jgi:hypothetical protein
MSKQYESEQRKYEAPMPKELGVPPASSLHARRMTAADKLEQVFNGLVEFPPQHLPLNVLWQLRKTINCLRKNFSIS